MNDDGRTCSPSCGGILTEASGSFHTPDWPNSSPSLDFRCEWVIDIDNMTDAVIEITFDETYGIRGKHPCPTDYVEVLDGIQHDSISLGKYCFKEAPDPIQTSTNQATVIFQASTFPHSSNKVGVSVSLQFSKYTYLIIFYHCFKIFKSIVDECETGEDSCEQVCIDTPKSYTCSCNDGYILHSDNQKCIGKMSILVKTFMCNSIACFKT